jgi:Gly-Xaa carboxypeptidase
MTTTQAADIIYGGAKINALPEVVSTFVNYRIDVGSSVAELQQRIFDTLLPTAKEFDLALVGFGRSFKPKHTAVGTVTLDTPAWGEDLEPAPISPTNVESPAWRMLAGTARAIWASRPDVSPDGTVANLSSTDDLIMAPYMMTGNTDTRRYWDLTGNIYRFRYISDTESQGVSGRGHGAQLCRYEACEGTRPSCVTSATWLTIYTAPHHQRACCE